MYIRGATTIGLVFILTSAVSAQELEVQSNSSLRERPSSGARLIRMLEPPERLVLEAPDKTDDYWQVRTELDEVGWVYANNVKPPPAPKAKSAVRTKSTSDLCPYGDPLRDEAVDFGPTVLINRDGYKLEHSGSLKIALWVCEHVTSAQLGGSLDREDRFRADRILPVGQRSELADYKGAGFDRGHLAPAGNQTKSARLKDETFFLSNMAPQDAELNRQVWRELEEHTRDWAANLGGAYIITGPMFYDPKEDDPATADGEIEYWTIGDNEVAVPTHFYKIVVTRTAAGSTSATAFLLANVRYPKPYDFSTYVVPIDQVERLTDLDFLPDLDDAEEKRIEKAVGKTW